MDIHPLAELFPAMADSDFARLKADIAANGQLEPVATYRAAVLDGRNRLRACEELGLPVKSVAWDGPDPLAFVLSKNLARRHLTESQRAVVAAKVANMKHGDNRFTKVESPIGDSTPKVSQQQAADMLNVSKKSVERAAEVLKSGDADLVAAVETGKVKVSAAANRLNGKVGGGKKSGPKRAEPKKPKSLPADWEESLSRLAASVEFFLSVQPNTVPESESSWQLASKLETASKSLLAASRSLMAAATRFRTNPR